MLFTLPTCASEPRKLIKSAANFRGAYNLKKKREEKKRVRWYFPFQTFTTYNLNRQILCEKCSVETV